MAKAKVKLNLGNLTVLELIALLRRVADAIDGNPDFPAPPYTAAQLRTLADELEAAYLDQKAKQQAAVQATSTLADKVTEVNDKITEEGDHVQQKSKGVKAKIEGAGMAVRATPSAPQDMEQVENLGVATGSAEETLDTNWDALKNVKSYELQMSEDPITATSWHTIKITTKSTFRVSGLTSGKKYWFRVRAIGAKNEGAWSDPATKVAP